MPQWWQDLAQFLSNNKDPLDVLLKILGFIGVSSIAGVVAWLIRRWWVGRLRVDIKAIEIILDRTILLQKLYGEENSPNPLADHLVPYQQRDVNRDLQGELRRALNLKRYLLIRGRTGLGKTREAATLAQSLMDEGYRIVRIKLGWLDVLKEFPPELQNNRRRILILLDDLNALFSEGRSSQSPQAEKMPMLSQPSYHDRLLRTLNYFENICGDREIRVIATARDEYAQWKLLDYDQHDPLWRKFFTVELPALTLPSTIESIEQLAAWAKVQTDRTDIPAIAEMNDGTFKNIVVNLQRLKAQNKPLTHTNYIETLEGSWLEVYAHAVQQHPAVSHIYDAIDLLRQTGVDLYPWIIEPTARLLWNGNLWQRLVHTIQIRRALLYLVNQERVLEQVEGKLALHDGQIEAKKRRLIGDNLLCPCRSLRWTLRDAEEV